MGTEIDPPPPDVRLAALAGNQYGLVTRGQLVAIGVGPHGIAERVRTGRLLRIHRGVYAVGHRALRPAGYWMAAVLACGADAVLSHRSAAALWDLRGDPPAHVDVTVPSRHGRLPGRGIRIHRTRRLAPTEVTERNGIPVTTVARTILDLADQLPVQDVKRAIDEAEYRGLFDLTALRAVIRDNPGRRGGRRLLALAAEPLALTRSEKETLFLGLCRRHGLPLPRAAVQIEGFEADFHWPEQRLIVEIDGIAAHRTRRAMERDRTRDRRLLLAGHRTVRLTPEALRAEPASIADDLRRLMEPGAGAEP
jgi:very-short-patch-repair endonuclease